ncbi:MAG: VOC family protein [Chloroflexota bacterium]
MSANPSLSSRQTVTPYLISKNASEAIAFYQRAFGAVELERMTSDDGRVGFAELQIGNARLMISDEYPEIDVLGPQSRGGTTVGLVINLEALADVDQWVERAVAAGARLARPAADQGVGVRNVILFCPYGHRWFISAVLVAAGQAHE